MTGLGPLTGHTWIWHHPDGSCHAAGIDQLPSIPHSSRVEERPGREAVVTDSEKAADRMVQDIMGDKIDRAGRQVVRRALDKKDSPPVGRDATDTAIGRISRGW